MRRIEARHHHRPLPPPALAVRGEQAIEAELARDHAETRSALEALGPVAQDAGDDLGIGDDADLPGADAEAVELAVSPAPFLRDQVQPGGVELEQVADQRQPARPGQVADAAWRGGLAHAGRVRLPREGAAEGIIGGESGTRTPDTRIMIPLL